MEKNTEKKPMNTRALKSGSYSLTVCAIAIVLVVVVNLIVNALPSAYTKPDTSSMGLFEISDETVRILKAVDTPVTMYLIAPRGQENSTVLELMNRYGDLSSKITVKTVDPDTNPTFVTRYTADTLSANSVIVESELRHSVVKNESIFVVSQLPQEQWTEQDYINYMYYGTAPTGDPYFYGEVLLTQAVDYVSSLTLPKVYVMTKHNEDALSATMLANFTTNNVLTADLNLLGTGAIPADCSAILLNNPKTDIEPAEAQMLTEYLQNGGNMILLTDYSCFSAEKMPNLASITTLMGMESEDGILLEGNSSNYYRYPTMLMPVIGTAGPAALLDSTNIYVFVPNAHGIRLTGTGDAAASSLLKTTTSSYVKKDWENSTTYEMEEGDVEGSFSVAASATLGEGKFVWYSSPNIINDGADATGGNSALFMASVNWMCDKQVAVSITAKLMQVQPLIVPAGAAGLWGTVLTLILPVGVLAAGFAVWFRRRRR